MSSDICKFCKHSWIDHLMIRQRVNMTSANFGDIPIGYDCRFCDCRRKV